MSGADAFQALRAHLLAHSVKTGDFTLKSGRKSSWFIDSKQTVCRPEAMLLVADAVLSVVPPEATAIGGLTMGADPVAFVTAGRGGDAGPGAEGLQRAQGGQGPRRRRAHRRGARPGRHGGGHRGHRDPRHVTAGSGARGPRGRGPTWCCWSRWSTGAGRSRRMAAAEGIPFRAILTAPDLGFPFEGA